MPKTAMESAITQAAAEWMEARSGLLQNVCQEVADELGPMIASEVVRGLAQVLIPTDKDRQILKLQSAALHVAEWIERSRPEMSPRALDESRRMSSLLYDAVGPDIPFNVPPAGLSDSPAGEDLAGHYPEGGDE